MSFIAKIAEKIRTSYPEYRIENPLSLIKELNGASSEYEFREFREYAQYDSNISIEMTVEKRQDKLENYCSETGMDKEYVLAILDMKDDFSLTLQRDIDSEHIRRYYIELKKLEK